MSDYHPDPDVVHVPDPYYGGAAGFDHVLDILETACGRLLDELIERHGLEKASAPR
jgi:protein-tyrosine phosphatase